MAELKKLEQAKTVFADICRFLENNQWHYKKDEERLTIECGARGEDLPIDLNIQVDADRLLVMIMSHIPFVINEDKRLEVALGICAINNILVDGCFDYDVNSGSMFFRMTNSFVDSKLGNEAYHYLIICACQTIDEYNDKLLMLAKGMLSVEQFLKTVANG